ncbi:MAG: DUF362 domain-containing protein [Candidatus Margulisiibacteriota bacterium]
MSKVFFTSSLDKVSALFDAASLSQIIAPNELVALKIHFGEPGNTAFLKPAQVKPISDKIFSLGGKPFFTDCNTLYHGPRKTTKEHLQVAIDHGFTKDSAGADSIIPEEEDSIEVLINCKHLKKAYLGKTAATKTIIALTHFKGHEVTGFGGALKNLGMGFGTRLGKLRMHQDCKNCAQAKTCKKNLSLEACWNGSTGLVQEKIVEYAYASIKDKKSAFITFLTKISPQCDCYDHNDEPIVPDIGILASLDPVAIDQAAADLVNNTSGRINGADKFKTLYPEVDWSIQLKYAEELGMGSRKYELICVNPSPVIK